MHARARKTWKRGASWTHRCSSLQLEWGKCGLRDGLSTDRVDRASRWPGRRMTVQTNRRTQTETTTRTRCLQTDKSAVQRATHSVTIISQNYRKNRDIIPTGHLHYRQNGNAFNANLTIAKCNNVGCSNNAFTPSTPEWLKPTTS